MTKTPSNLDQHIGLRIKMRRILMNMSQDTLAQKLNITFQQLQKYEKSTNRVSASRLYDIANALDIEITYFFEGYHVDSKDTLRETVHAIKEDTPPKKATLKISQKSLLQSLMTMPSGKHKTHIFTIIKQEFQTLNSKR